MAFPHCKRPCEECPWRADNVARKFPAKRYRALVDTAVDMAMKVFGCHMTTERRTVACAGFLLSQDAAHNLRVRMAASRGALDLDAIGSPVPLYPNYFTLATVNGVAADDPALALLRADCR